MSNLNDFLNITGNTISATGNVSGSTLLGNVANVRLINYGTTSVNTATQDGPVTIVVGNIAAGAVRANSTSFGTGSNPNANAVSTVAVGYNSQNDGTAGTGAVAVGASTGTTTQGAGAVAVGQSAGTTTQGAKAVAIGSSAGTTTQGANAIAIGTLAGTTSQSVDSIAIGNIAGTTSQGAYTVAVGYVAGSSSQGNRAVAVGQNAGASGQGAGAVAIGSGPGASGQGANSIAIGTNAGASSLTTNSIAIGTNAANTAAASVIVLNASGSNLAAATANALYINPVRDNSANIVAVSNVANTTIGNVMVYNTSTKEVGFSNSFIASNIYIANASTANSQLSYYPLVLDSNNVITKQPVIASLSPVIDNTIVTPPSNPALDDAYLIPATGATGDWVGHGNQIATWTGAAWSYYTPVDNNSTSVISGTNSGKVYLYTTANGWVQSIVQQPLAFTTWQYAGTYAAGTIVTYQNSIWQANGNVAANTTFVPGTTGSTWQSLSTQGVIASYAKYTRTTNQASVVANTVIVLNAAESAYGSDIVVDTTSGNVTLTAGKTYRLRGAAGASVANSGANPSAQQTQWFNVTTGQWVGQSGGPLSVAAGYYDSVPMGTAEYVFTPAVTTVVQFRMRYCGGYTLSLGPDPANLIQTNGGYPWMDIQVIGGLSAVTGAVATNSSIVSPVADATAIGTTSATATTAITYNIPGAGTWRLDFSGPLQGPGGNGAYASFALYDSTGTEVANSRGLAAFTNAATIMITQVTNSYIVTTSAPTTYTIRAWGAPTSYIRNSATYGYIVGRITQLGTTPISSSTLTTKASAFVARGTDVVLGNFKARWSGSGNMNIQFSTVSGTYSTVCISLNNNQTTVNGGANSAFTVTTTPTSPIPSNVFATVGDLCTWTVTDYSAGVAWRVTGQVGSGFNNNFLMIEQIL